MSKLDQVQALTFDLFGTVLVLGGSLTPFLSDFLESRQVDVNAVDLWASWRARQRIEQYQDTIVMLGHSGYIETARRALVYVLELHGVPATADDVSGLMQAWQRLQPFPEVKAALQRLQARYKLVALSNGNAPFLAHLVKSQIKWAFRRGDISRRHGGLQAAPGCLSPSGEDAGLRTVTLPHGLGQFVRRHGGSRLRDARRFRQSQSSSV